MVFRHRHHHYHQQHHHLVIQLIREMFLFLIVLEFDFHSIDSIFRLLVLSLKGVGSNFVVEWPLERASDPTKDENRN